MVLLSVQVSQRPLVFPEARITLTSLMGIPGLTYNGYGDMTECFVEEHQLESRGKN